VGVAGVIQKVWRYAVDIVVYLFLAVRASKRESESKIEGSERDQWGEGG
jgi:hypothetical protein